MVFFEKFEEKFEYLFLKPSKHRVFDNNYHLGVVVDDCNLVSIDHLADIVIEEIKMFWDCYKFSFQPWFLGFSECLARDDATLNLFHGNQCSIIAREIGLCFLEIAAGTVAIIGFSLFESIKHIIKHKLDTLFTIECFDGWFHFPFLVECFKIENSRIETLCKIFHDSTEFIW